MRFPDNWFREVSPADIISRIGTVTLANISLLGTEELLRIGWLNNPVIDILYSMTSAGVWVAKTDSSGVVTTKLNGAQQNYLASIAKYGYQGVAAPDMGSSLNQAHRLGSVSFVSNAGGTIDTDPELVPALAGYYGVCRFIAIVCDDATTPVFEVQEGTTGLANNQSPGVLVANVNKAFDENYLWGGTDNTALSIDGSDCSDLGNAKNYTIYFEYWYET